ncbi:GNAT family N-acetyltransferase [Salinicoccus sp. ID82-1]|uniref:GNAT family N-acetyltransferase n=1 Tax=Salinicoccus sp. ID82-1 TaxID=2820269 RepID=UPI001F3A4D88|nr:GNAT family N-acetyltransferase [Salinicoccus sp. ID82-1]MCG1010761.1 GNAT family N-acetyltransferase [Salinicoccus sp. ID82-1]
MGQINNKSKDFTRKGIEFEGKLVGYVDMTAIEKDTVELGIAIGESDLWGKGIGTKALLHTIENVSRSLGITTFQAETQEENVRSRGMLKKLGFKEIQSVVIENHIGTNDRIIQYELTLSGGV